MLKPANENGADIDKIRAKALANKLVTETELAALSDQQVMQFIFKAGFSTAAQVTSVSGRGVGMDVVRTNIEKIGGTVDLVTKRAPLEASTQVNVGGGYAAISQDYIGTGAFTIGRRFNEGKTGLLLSLSANKSNRASDDQEPEYDEQNLIDFQLRDYTLTRERYAANLSLDRQTSSGSELFLRALYDEYKDTEIRRAMDNVVEDGEIARDGRLRLPARARLQPLAGGYRQLRG